MSEWQPIETAPKDGTRIDLWMVDKSGSEYREPEAYWVSAGAQPHLTKRDGWYAPRYDYDLQDGWADDPYHYINNRHIQKWVGCEPSHWMPIPAGPNGQEA